MTMRVLTKDGRVEYRSNWSSDISLAPRGPHLLFRHPEWQCPAIVRWTDEYDGLGEWVFCEELLAEADGSIFSTEGMEWAMLPE